MEKFSTFITSVLVFFSAVVLATPLMGCTGILLKAKDGSFVHGRTLEFGFFIPTSIIAIPKGYSFTGATPKGEGMQYAAKYNSLGIMTFENPIIADGINEKGLAVGSFYFPGFAKYTEITSENQAKALSPLDFNNWLLTQFATIDEVKTAIENGEVVIAPTVIKGWGSEPPPLHYIVYDKSGKSIVIEPVDGELQVRDNPIGVITNSPNFDWHMTNMRNYISLSAENAPPVKIDGETFKELGQGSGMFGLPGDFTPPSRFVRAAVFSAAAIPSANSEEGSLQAFHILNNFDIPVGVARSESDGVVQSDYTMLTVVRDPQQLRFYWKTYADQTLRSASLKEVDFSGSKIKKLSTKNEQTVIDMSNQLN